MEMSGCTDIYVCIGVCVFVYMYIRGVIRNPDSILRRVLAFSGEEGDGFLMAPILIDISSIPPIVFAFTKFSTG